ncbi:MAG TPA: hypothetical protein VGY98_10005, partial [Verrucomicrobiae bacterium]|nr:hypothetical protein [Verrucomicrobiae bacterium]
SILAPLLPAVSRSQNLTPSRLRPVYSPSKQTIYRPVFARKILARSFTEMIKFPGKPTLV